MNAPPLETTLTDIIARLRQGRFQNEQAVSWARLQHTTAPFRWTGFHLLQLKEKEDECFHYPVA